MKLIKGIQSQKVSTDYHKPIKMVETKTALEEAKTNKLRVIDSALVIEDSLAGVIQDFFFPRPTEAGNKPSRFMSFILATDWCSYGAKRKVISHILDDGGWLEKKEKDLFVDDLRRVGSYRNAFAHGDMWLCNGEVELRYYENKSRCDVLTDEHLQKVDDCLRSTFRRVTTLRSLILGDISTAKKLKGFPASVEIIETKPRQSED